MQDRSSIRPPYTSETIDDKSLSMSINKQKEYKSYLGSVHKSQNDLKSDNNKILNSDMKTRLFITMDETMDNDKEKKETSLLINL
jgi:hypothetical protein